MSFDTPRNLAELKAASEMAVTDADRATGLGPEPQPGGGHRGWRDLDLPEDGDLWVFGYGSLMWNPGFPFAERCPATLYGYHRSFCVYSYHYRGTLEQPGLVLGLDRGGSCRGVAFRTLAPDRPAVLDYLWDREMTTNVYRPRILHVHCAEHERAVTACTFVVDRAHSHYCGGISVAEAAYRIGRSVGQRGPNIEYLVNTVRHMEELGIAEGTLHDLLRTVRRLHPQLEETTTRPGPA